METLKKIDKIINTENNKIKDFNQKVNNKNQVIEGIKLKFWQILRNKYEADISSFQQQSDQVNLDIEIAASEIKTIESEISSQATIISSNQKKTKNIEEAITNINNTLKSFGFCGFELQKARIEGENDHFYKIARKESLDGKDTFRTLSEGEKTLITFLYFVETCRGERATEKVSYENRRIIVIDDPISSLSFNIIFDIAILIKELFLKEDTIYKQIFILTHHLYFLHELFGNTQNALPKNFTLFRVTKCVSTKIKPAQRKDIKNNYECYWQLIKDVKEGNASPAILPYAMRNILEHYFSFIHGESKLKLIIDELSKTHNDSSFRAYHRYIDRSCHSDAINLSDTNDINIDNFIIYFKAIFYQTGYGMHYAKMMGEKFTPQNANTSDFMQAEES